MPLCCTTTMNTSRVSTLASAVSVALLLALGGCVSSSGDASLDESPDPSSTVPDVETLDPEGGGDPVAEAAPDDRLRAELAAAMATNRVVRYSEAWTVLADGARVAPGRIELFYTERVIDEDDRASGDDQAELDFWNREHVWPRSFGIDETPAETDLHNLVPVDMTVNSARSNRLYDDDGRAHRECERCLIGDGSWAPPPERRGDAARIAFYMDVRYDGLTDRGVPDLALSDEPNAAGARFGRLSTLIRWHCEDGVSSEEIRRHAAAAAAQGNRNAFVDAPELVEQVYGVRCPW